MAMATNGETPWSAGARKLAAARRLGSTKFGVSVAGGVFFMVFLSCMEEWDRRESELE